MNVARQPAYGSGQIHTSFHAGGIASCLMRRISSLSLTVLPDASRNEKPLPRATRVRPGREQSERRGLRLRLLCMLAPYPAGTVGMPAVDGPARPGRAWNTQG